jgi:hypothetical protein
LIDLTGADDLAAAIERSKRTHQEAADSDIQTAIQLSMMGDSARPMQIDGDFGMHVTDEERAVNEAVLKSLSSANAEGVSTASSSSGTGLREPTPLERRRDGVLPVGLRNVGNTCYLNSLIQAYFGLPSLRSAVLRLPDAPPAAVLEEHKPTVEFIKALQKLFAQLLLSNQTYIDPSPMIKALRSDDGRPVTIGGQEDVAEFNELFLQRVREGLNLMLGTKAPLTPLRSSAAAVSTPLDVSPIASKLGGEQKRPKRDSDATAASSAVPVDEDDSGGVDVDVDDDDGGGGDDDATLELDLSATTDTLNRSQREPDFVTRLFAGTTLNVIETAERDGQRVELRNRESFSALILPVTDVVDESKPSHEQNRPLTLYRAIDEYVQNEVDFTTPRGYATRARSTSWIERLPRVLVIHESRVQFAAATSSAHKCSKPLQFGELIHLDRYLIACREQSVRARQRVRELDERLAKLTARLNVLESLPQALVQSHSFVEQHDTAEQVDDALIDAQSGGRSLSALSAAELAAALQVLTAARNDALARVAVLSNAKSSVEREIDAAYDGMRKRGYRLLAVCVHSGIPSSGHYWAYVRRIGNVAVAAAATTEAAATTPDKPLLRSNASSMEPPADVSWVRFNDRMVSTVSSSDVWRDAVGARDSSTSAYMLMYVDESMLQQEEAEQAHAGDAATAVSDLNAPGAVEALARRHGVPEAVFRAIEQENATFRKSCDDASKEQDDSRARQCVERLRVKWNETENHAATKDEVRDPLVKSYFAWLVCDKQRELAAYEVFKEVYVISFERGVTADGEAETSRFKRVLDLCSEANLAQFGATQMRRLMTLERGDAVQQALMESNRRRHAVYVAGARQVEQMLSALLAREFQNAASLAQLVVNRIRTATNEVVGGARDRLAAETLAVAAMALAEQSLLQLQGALNELSQAADGRVNANAPHNEHTSLAAAAQHLRMLWRACTYSVAARRGATEYVAARIRHYTTNMRGMVRTAHVAGVIAYATQLQGALTAHTPSAPPMPADLFPGVSDGSNSIDAAVLRSLLLSPKQQEPPVISPQHREELSNRLADVERRVRAMHSDMLKLLTNN